MGFPGGIAMGVRMLLHKFPMRENPWLEWGQMETPAVAGASLRFTTVIDFNPKAEVPVNHTGQFIHNNLFEQDYLPLYQFHNV